MNMSGHFTTESVVSVDESQSLGHDTRLTQVCWRGPLVRRIRDTVDTPWGLFCENKRRHVCSQVFPSSSPNSLVFAQFLMLEITELTYLHRFSRLSKYNNIWTIENLWRQVTPAISNTQNWATTSEFARRLCEYWWRYASSLISTEKSTSFGIPKTSTGTQSRMNCISVSWP